jgi:hypothetical protein
MSESKTLLQQIEEEAVDSKSDVAALLRKCIVLASRLQNQPLKQWLKKELNGYKTNDELPSYRIIPCNSLGVFYGSGWSKLSDAPIPPSCIPEKYRKIMSEVTILDGIGELQSIVNKDENEESICQPWPADLIALVSRSIYRNMSMVSAHKTCPATAIIGILETIRSRILDFVLALEENCPEAGEAIGSTKLDKKEIDQMVTNNIFKGVGNVALQCGTVSQNNTVNVEKGNWILLENLLREAKIEAEHIRELKDILEKDPPKSKTNLGSHLSAWIGTICAKAASGLYSIPFDTISNVLAGAICKYMGIA